MRSPSTPTYVSSHDGMLALLELGTNITSITGLSGWPTRPIHSFAGRHGYLFTRDGIPFQPAATDPEHQTSGGGTCVPACALPTST